MFLTPISTKKKSQMSKMLSIAFALAIPAAGTILSFTAFEVNPAQAAIKSIENDSYQLSNQTAPVVRQKAFSHDAKSLKQRLGAELPMRGSNIIAQRQLVPLRNVPLLRRSNVPLVRGSNIIGQAQLVPLRTFALRSTTNADGFFSAPHGLPGNKIEGVVVSVQHINGNWHTLEFSNQVDNRFWFNNSVVEGIINSSNFAKRPVKIILFVRR